MSTDASLIAEYRFVLFTLSGILSKVEDEKWSVQTMVYCGNIILHQANLWATYGHRQIMYDHPYDIYETAPRPISATRRVTRLFTIELKHVYCTYRHLHNDRREYCANGFSMEVIDLPQGHLPLPHHLPMSRVQGGASIVPGVNYPLLVLHASRRRIMTWSVSVSINLKL